MWPRTIEWTELTFGVEIEFVGGAPTELELLPDWEMALDERQIDETGEESGSELKPPPIRWADREQIRTMLRRLREQGALANWSCGLHVHVGLEPWGEDALLPMLEAALASQQALEGLLRTSGHRLLFCPPVLPEMVSRFREAPCSEALRRTGRPQSHRCGLNFAAWYDIGTVEIRYANGSLDEDEVLRTIELCLRYVAALGAGWTLPTEPPALAERLGVPAEGYPPPAPAPRWFQERMWLEEMLRPILAPLALQLAPAGEIHHILPVEDGLLLAVETQDDKLDRAVVKPGPGGWRLDRVLQP
ncbi:hypothetical protein J31TS4_37900 [Paenibacillus sp. J31TS4]|uniref:amidoligase family protein n=1 Tax=Paenibacillus sp. J31TS4 TaxID=2807195 RepID=UPI001AFCEC04|nr:amidoligase family protein [Paenibacillus sp. J31TS4]GIP40510.1 hypothetical protein J31TS4_37900 [Paenibacillus sp. J31TS4]